MVASVLNDFGASLKPSIPFSILFEMALSDGDVSGNKVAFEVNVVLFPMIKNNMSNANKIPETSMTSLYFIILLKDCLNNSVLLTGIDLLF